MTRFFSTIFLLFLLSKAFAQGNIDRVLEEIEKNNTELAAFEDQQIAQGLEHRTGIYLPDPEFSFAWFSGNPEQIGSKTNLTLMQSFDFPTAYGHKSRIASLRIQQQHPEYHKQRSELLLEARLICLELVYHNALSQVYANRIQHAQDIAQAYSEMLDAGHANILEYNKARLNLLNLQKVAEINSIDRQALQDRLTGLNAGIPISLTDIDFPVAEIHGDFEQWYSEKGQNNPMLQWLTQEIAISQRQEKLQRAMILPGFTAGYVSEALTHEQFRGFMVGITIPMWEHKNTLKQAKAQTIALEKAAHDNNLQFYNFLRMQHSKAISLQNASDEYRNLVESLDNIELLNIALEQGGISLTNYILELSFVYQSIDNILQMELDFHQSLALLNQYLE